MSHTSMKKSVFERIERGGGNSSSSSNPTTTSHKSTHGFCNTFIKTGTCPLGDTCKYIHEQPNLDKQQGSKEELRITKTITRVVDMSSPPIKSTVTVSNEQRLTSSATSTSSSRTVVESGSTLNDQSDRRLSSSDRKQSQSRSSDSKRKSPSNSNESSSKKKGHSSSKSKRSMDSSPYSSLSDSEHTHSSHKRKKKTDTRSTSIKYKTQDSMSPQHDEDETLHDQLVRQTQSSNKSPKRTIVISDRKKDENTKRSSKDSKSNPDIEFLGSKIVNRDKKSTETIHQQAESNKKSIEIKRERKSPSKSSLDSIKRSSSSTTEKIERITQIKSEDTKNQSSKIQNSTEQSDRNTPPVVQLSPSPSITTASDTLEKGSSLVSSEPEKATSVQPPSPICVILDDDSDPSPTVDKKVTRQPSPTPVKRTHESDNTSSKQSKRSRDSDKSHSKEKRSESSDAKRKRPTDGSSTKTSSNRKSENDVRSASNRSDSHRSATSSSNRKYQEKTESKTGKKSDSKDRSASSSSKSRSNPSRRDTTRSSPEKKHSTHRRAKEKGLENITDSEEHADETVLPKQIALEAYIAMDWSTLSRDKRIPMNTQVSSRIARVENTLNSVGIAERLLTDEQKAKFRGIEFQSSPLTHFIKQLQTKPNSQVVNSCNRRFGSCAKDMIDMRHKWFLRSTEPVQQYEFINKEHYLAFQQAINSLLDKTSNDNSTVQIETTPTDVLLS